MLLNKFEIGDLDPAFAHRGFRLDELLNFFRSTCRVQNRDIPRAGRVRAHGGMAWRGRAGLDANKIGRLGDTPPSHPPEHRKHEQRKYNLNRWGNKNRG